MSCNGKKHQLKTRGAGVSLFVQLKSRWPLVANAIEEFCVITKKKNKMASTSSENEGEWVKVVSKQSRTVRV